MRQFLFPDKNPFARLGFTIVLTLSSFLIVYLIASMVSGLFFGPEARDAENLKNFSDPSNLGILRYYQIVLSIALFVLPPLVLAWLFSGKTTEYLYLNRFSKLNNYGIVFFMMVVAIPIVNLLSYLNAHIHLPEFLSGVEAYFIRTEKSAEEQTFAFLNVSTPKGLLFNVFMIGLLPAVGEELMFRGILQRLFGNITRNPHWGIIISSFLFSAIHFQFYGLFPRWLLGIMFGYMLLWSGSLWLPIAAHFLNNFIAVAGYYFFSSDNLRKNITELGSTPDMLVFSAISLVLLLASLYLLYTKRQNYYIIKD